MGQWAMALSLGRQRGPIVRQSVADPEQHRSEEYPKQLKRQRAVEVPQHGQ
jgi:hypothetical protein